MIESPSRLLVDEGFNVEYVGEGAANVVFRLVRHQSQTAVHTTSLSLLQPSTASPCSETQTPSRETHQVSDSCYHGTDCLEIENIDATSLYDVPSSAFDSSHVGSAEDEPLPLLRLRKDLATVTSVVDAHESYQRLVLPYLDKENVVELTLALLPDEMVDRCNAYLVEMEAKGIRPKKRRNCYLAYQPYANLVQDMSPQSDTDTVLEFKLKWLTQSPSAPQGSKRCRTCAIRAMRMERALDTLPDKAYCPLDLGNPNQAFIEAVLTGNLRHEWKPEREDQTVRTIARATSEQLLQSGLIRKVKELQQSMDPVGILQARIDDQFLVAMTLRDCTLFIRVDKQQRVEARLGDIDLKPITKASYWRVTEQRLIAEGWYTCEEDGNDGKDPICLLSRF